MGTMFDGENQYWKDPSLKLLAMHRSWHIYVLRGVWCPAGCGSRFMYYACPSYGQSADYVVWCANDNCYKVVGESD